MTFLIFLNAFLLLLLSFAVGAATHSVIPSYALNPVFWAVGGIMGMFILVTLIGEGIIWLRKEITEGLADLKRLAEKT